jgi:hypothetical protein
MAPSEVEPHNFAIPLLYTKRQVAVPALEHYSKPLNSTDIKHDNELINREKLRLMYAVQYSKRYNIII